MVAVRRRTEGQVVCRVLQRTVQTLTLAGGPKSSCALTLKGKAWKPVVKQEKKLTRGTPWFGTFSLPP